MPTKAELVAELEVVKHESRLLNAKYEKAVDDHSKRERQLTMNLEYICDESNLFWYAISDAYVAAYIEPDSLMSSDDAPKKTLIFKIPCLQGWLDDKNPDEPTFEEKLHKLYEAVKEMSSGWVDQRVVVEKCIRDSNY